MATRKNGTGKEHKAELAKWGHEITELELFAENEGKLYESKKRVIAAAKVRIERGDYDDELAVQLWRPWVDEAVKEYGRQFRMTDLPGAFPAIVRNEVARRIGEGEAAEIRKGNYGELQKPAAPRARTSKSGKLPRLHVGRIPVNRHGYTPTGRYVGVGGPLFRAFNTANNQEVEFRAPNRADALSIAKRMFTEPRAASVTERFTPGQVKDFVSND